MATEPGAGRPAAAKPEPATPPAPAAGGTAAVRPDTEVEPARAQGVQPPPGGWVGAALGKYRVLGVLGRGGMGLVVKAHDPTIGRDVAIKILAADPASDAEALGRFLAEARAAGCLSHPHVIAIHELFQEGPAHYLVLEFAAGGSLGDGLDAGRALSVLGATQALIDACKGVGAAHAAGLIHRDLKPANLMRAADGSVKVADFGLAKAAAGSGMKFTQTGTVVGTPFFMSPEQCQAKPLDARSDVYSLGGTYYSLLTGRYPYEDTDSVPQLMYMHCHGPVPDPCVNPAVPPACAEIVARAMAKDPADRYQSTGEMLADLQAVAATMSGQVPIRLPSGSGAVRAARRAGPWWARAVGGRRRFVVAGLCLLVLAGLAVALWRPWEKGRDGAAGGPSAFPPDAEPIKIGVLHSLTGTMAASEAPVVDAVLFALDEINDAGGVLGRPVKPVVADGRSDAATFAREAEHLIAEEGVCTVFGCWTSASRKEVKPVVERHDHLLVYPLQFEGLETSPCIMYMGAAPNQQIFPALEWAMKDLGKKRFFFIGSDYVFPRAAQAIISDRLQRAGTQLAGTAYVPLGSPKVEAAVAAIKRAKPDMILNAINGDSNVAFFRALREAGVTSADIPTLSFSISEQGLRSLNAADLAGEYAVWAYFESVDTPANREFVRRFHAKQPQDSITDPMETSYVAAKMWALALKECHSLDPKKIRRALLNQRFNGPGGEVRIDPDTQYSYRTPRVARVDADGQFQVVWTAPAPVRPEPYPAGRTAEAWRAFLHDLSTGWGGRWEAPRGEAPKPTTPDR